MKEHDLKLHVDGARIWHAIQEDKNNMNYGDYCDSLTFCFSKALGAPIGSMLLGSKEFIKEAREYRKKLGGGMRTGWRNCFNGKNRFARQRKYS